MFLLAFDLLLSTMPGVRCTDVFTQKSLRNMETSPLATRVGQLKPPYLEEHVCEIGYKR